MTDKNEWRRIGLTKMMPCHRTGWLGVYDALRSAITGEPRLVVTKAITVSMLIKGSDGELDMHSAHAEGQS